MNKKNKILNIIFIIISCTIVFFIAKGRLVDRRPILDIDSNSLENVHAILNAKTTDNYTFFDNAYDLFLGHGFPTLLTALITVILSFLINKLFIKQKLNLKHYILLFLIIFILNMVIYRLGINIDNGLDVVVM